MANEEHDDPAMFCSREMGRAARTVMGAATVAAQRQTAQKSAEAKQTAERAQTETQAVRQSNKGKRDAAKRRKRQEQAWAAKSGPVVTRQMTDEERDR